MVESKKEWPPTEGMISEQPVHNPASEEQCSKLLGIIHKLIDINFSLSEIEECCLGYNSNQPKPLADADVLDMCKLGCGERELQEPTTSS